MRFELDRLADYSDEALVAELKRVSALVGDEPLTLAAFSKFAKVSPSTMQRRFGGWEAALCAAGLTHRYSGHPVTEKMKAQHGKGLTNEQLLSELQRVASELHRATFTRAEFNERSNVSHAAFLGRFGGWRNALERAGLNVSPVGRRYTDEECFENLLRVWTRLGRPPQYKEMSGLSSTVGPKAYVKRWGTWNKALHAFVERVNSDVDASSSSVSTSPAENVGNRVFKPRVSPADTREIRLGLRYTVLKRDHFRCVVCGSSPATKHDCLLHVDHILPWSKGGKTVVENLRTLCEQCNLGKGARLE